MQRAVYFERVNVYVKRQHFTPRREYMQTPKIVITGIGLYTSVGNNREDFREAMVNGVSGADKIRSFDATTFKSKVAAE